MKLFLQLVFLVSAITYLILIYCFRFASPDNFLNQTLRSSFIRFPFAQTIFFLHRPGDARYQLNSASPLIISVKSSSDITPNPELTNWLVQMVSDTLHHPAQIVVDPIPIESMNSLVSDSVLKSLSSSYARSVPQAQVHIYYLKQSESAPTNAGQALDDRDMVIFANTIKGLSERQSIQAMIEQSTLMHEWGHLLGLEHIDDESCIMNEKVEVYGNRRFQGSNIPTEYCPTELSDLHRLLE